MPTVVIITIIISLSRIKQRTYSCIDDCVYSNDTKCLLYIVDFSRLANRIYESNRIGRAYTPTA